MELAAEPRGETATSGSLLIVPTKVSGCDLNTWSMYYPGRPSTREVCGPDPSVYGEHVVAQ